VTPATYLDSSALVKLAVEEPESGALRAHLRRRKILVSSALARTEVLRALLLEGEEGVARGRAVLGRIELIRVNDRLLTAAGLLQTPDVRSLDAIHLATAQELGSDLSQVISYDERMVEAAKGLGLKTASPA
jgi:predicted nucleic acid-binding protein